MNRLFWRLHQIDPDRPEPKKLQFAVRRQALSAYLRDRPGLQAELAREEVADLGRFSENIDALTARIVRRVNDLGSTLPTLPGCAGLTAAKLISEAANVDRFPNESAFARYGGWHRFRNGRARPMVACVYAVQATGKSTPPSTALPWSSCV
jgi:transposase